MPPVVPFIPLIAAALSTGTTIASQEGVFGGGPSAPPAPTGPQAPTPQELAAQQAQKQQQAQLVANQFPGITSATSGFTTPQYLETQGLLQSGQGGQQDIGQMALNSFFGQGNNTAQAREQAFTPVSASSAGSGSSFVDKGLSDMLTKLGVA